MEQQLRRHLTTCAQRYAAATGLAVVTVGRTAAKDWQFFTRIAEGSGFTARKYDEVMAWFVANWPDATPWPDDVPRPVKAEAAA